MLLNSSDVLNQSVPFEDVDLLAADVPLQEALEREGGGWAVDRVRDCGLVAGSAEDLGRHDVEVFDQLPELPDGWGEEGPASVSTSSAGPATARSRTGLLLLVLGLLMILAAVLLSG